MSTTQSSDHISSDSTIQSVGYERQDVNVKAIIVSAIICIFILVASLLCLDSYFVYYRELLIKQSTSVEPIALHDLHERDNKILNRYGIIDKSNGIYHIPIDNAFDHIIRERSQPDK